MHKTALAKTVENEAESPELARLRTQIVDIISNEYIGDVRSELWLQPARRAADQIVKVIALGANSLRRVNLSSPRISRAPESLETSSPSSPPSRSSSSP
jgi:hypothetical protein